MIKISSCISSILVVIALIMVFTGNSDKLYVVKFKHPNYVK